MKVKPRYSVGDILIGWGKAVIILFTVLAIFVAAVWIVDMIVGLA